MPAANVETDESPASSGKGDVLPDDAKSALPEVKTLIEPSLDVFGGPAGISGELPRPLERPAERIFLYVVLTVALLLFVGLVIGYYFGPDKEFQKAMSAQSVSNSISPGCYYTFRFSAHALTVMFSLRYLQMTMGAMVIVVGSMFVLKGVRAAYQLSVSRGNSRSSLETSSPGLVLITLGALIMVAALYRTQSLDLQTPPTCLGAAPQMPSSKAEQSTQSGLPRAEDALKQLKELKGGKPP